jgi:murein DD-endopeptidase MepM/ murein hydrolase activator NlpD
MEVRTVGSPAPAGGNSRADADAQRVELARLAHEFEAMFLSEMMRGMRESMLSDEQDEGLGAQTMTDTFDGELGIALSKKGGLGLAGMLLEALSRNVRPQADDSVGGGFRVQADETPAAAVTAVPDAGAGVSSAVQPASMASALPGPVTSPFGWRSDPFTGRAQFHAGTDIRMAYGHDVQAVAPGRVVSVGERSGYGLMVVVDHGDGLETRYAHLSAASVKEGDVVEAGEVVAQSGSSGRSTGPHLHLEARQDGRAIDMAALLKETGRVADSYAVRNYVRSGHED